MLKKKERFQRIEKLHFDIDAEELEIELMDLETQVDVITVLANLTDVYRYILVAKYIENKGIDEISLETVAQNSKESQPENKIVVGLSVIWIAFAFLIFSEFRTSIYMLDLIKSTIGLSLVLIPVSSIILIILKFRVYEKNMV